MVIIILTIYYNATVEHLNLGKSLQQIVYWSLFFSISDEIFELDGGNSQPISHGPSSPDSLLQVKSLISVVYFHQLFPFLYMFLQIYVLYT